MRIKVRKLVEAPPNVQEVVERISSTPIQDIASVLRGFVWNYDKGDINHWVPVLDHFDAFLENYVSTRADVQLKLGEEGVLEDLPFPTDTVLAVLRATCTILENCSNKGAYNSSEHLSSLLAAPVLEVSSAALQVLQVLLRKTHHTSVRLAVLPGLTQRLLSLCRGWGGKEEGLDLVVCASADEVALLKVQHKATVLDFQFTPDTEPAGAGASEVAVQPLALTVPGVDKFTEPEHIILAELVKRYKVPAEARLDLLCRIRIARNFGTLAGRRQLIRQRLLAFNVLLQCNPSAEEYNSLYAAEPELVSELVALVQAEDSVDQEELRTLALRALAAQLQDRSRSSSVMAAVTSGGQSGLLAMLMHKSVASILQQADVPLAPSGSGLLPATEVARAQARGVSSSDGVAAVVKAAAAAPVLGSVQYSVAFVDALLALAAALVTSSSGCQALNDAGVISALLPLLRDHHPDHLNLVCTSLKILEMYMDLSQTASTTFRDLGGLSEVIRRLAHEVDAVAGTQRTAAPGATGKTGDADVVMATVEQSIGQTSTISGDQAAVEVHTAMKQLPHNRKSLLKILLRIITISSYQPTGNLSATRPIDDDAQLLYASLKAMYSRAEEFGGTLFSHAVSVMTDLIHHEPQSFRQLQEAGLPDAFLDAVKAGVFPSGDAICAFPGALVALCLNNAGLKRVRETAALNVLVDIFVSKKAMRVLTGDTPSVLGSGLEELMRFVPSLRSDGVNVVLGVFKALCILGGDEGEQHEASKPLPAEAPQEQPAVAVEPAQAATAGAEVGTDAAASGSITAPLAAVQQMETGIAATPAPDVEQLNAAAAGSGAGAAQAGAETPADEMEVDGQQQQAAATEQPVAVPQVEPTRATAAPAAAAQAALPEHEHSRQLQQAEDARLSANAECVLAQSLHQLAARQDLEEDTEAFLPLALTAASRMLEPLLANAETSRLFVERGGADLLLKLYKLPRLTTVFNFSSASHSLLSVFRALSGAHGSAIAAKSKEAVAQQLAQLLPMAEAVGPVCVPTLPTDIRAQYVKQVLMVQGLVALTSAVARNVTAMLPQVSMGDPPLLASMGKLERIVMAQAAASDTWKQARDAAKRAAAAAQGAAADGHVHGRVVLDAGPGADTAEGGVDPAADGDGGDGDDDVMEGATAEQAPDRVLPEDGTIAQGSAASNSKHKRSPQDTAYDALSYLLTSLRTFYMGTAKAIHTPVRRREEGAAAPTAPMKAAALNLALLLVGNLRLRPWHQQQLGLEAPSTATLQASSFEGGSSTSSSVQQQLDAAVAAVRSRSGHFLRVIDELSQVLFDNRRHYCHLLVLNYFSALGGMQVYASAVSDAAVLMWQLLDLQEAAKAAQPVAPGDQALADLQQGSGTTAGAAPLAPPEAQATAATAASSASAVFPGTAGTKEPQQIMEAVLVKMLVVYEQLANATVLLSAPQATHMLLAALPNYAGQPLVPPARDALQFVQELHSHIMCAVLPLWSHPKIAHAPSGVLAAVIRVLQTCCQGPGHASLMLRYTQRPAAARIQAQPDAQMVQQIIEMGFSQPRAEEALRRVGANSVELAMEWLITHPEEPAAPAGGQATGSTAAGSAAPDAAMTEEEELTRALLASLSVVGMSPDAVAQRNQQEPAIEADTSNDVVHQAAATMEQQQVAMTPEATPRPVVPPNAPVLGGFATAAAAVGTAMSGPAPAGPAASGGAAIGVPAPSQLIDAALRLISAAPATAFSIADLVLTVAQREEGKDREALLERLLNDCLPPAADTASTSAVQQTAPGASTLTPARLLLLLLHKDPDSRRLAAAKGIVHRCLQVLEEWQWQYTAAVKQYESLDAEKQQAEQEVKALEVPVWVEAVLLLLDLSVTTQPKIATPPAATSTREAGRATAETAPSATPSSAVEGAAAAAAAGGLAQQAAGNDVQMGEQSAAARTGAAAPNQQATAPAVASGDAAGLPLPPELSQLPGLKQLLANWKPCGMLDEQQQDRAAAIALTLLQQLHQHASKWDKPGSSMFEAEGSLPNPGSATSVVLQLLSHLTRRHTNAQRVLAAGGHKLLLSLPSACLAPSASRQEGHIGAIFRHLLEDPITLEAWMESEIKNSMSVKGVRDPYPYARPYNQANPLSRSTTAASFLTMMSSLVSRDPAVFLQAVARTCALETTRGETMVRLKTLKEQQQQQTPAVSRDHANTFTAPLLKPTAVAAATGEAGATAGTLPAAAPASRGGSTEGLAPAPVGVICDAAAAKSSEQHVSKPASRSGRKLVPGNFVEVIDALLDVVLGYKGIKTVQVVQKQPQQHHNTPDAAAMEVDTTLAPAGGRALAAASAAAGPAAAGNQHTAPLPADLLLRKLSPGVHEIDIQTIVLRMLADYCLLYNSTVGLLLKRDGESGLADGRAVLLHHHLTAAPQLTPGHEGPEGSKSVAKPRSARHTGVSGSSIGGAGRSSMPSVAAAGPAGVDHKAAGAVLKHIMAVQLLDSPPQGINAGAGVAANASALLQAVCIRSGEGRKRIVHQVVSALSSDADQGGRETGDSTSAGKPNPKLPYIHQPGGPEPVKVAAYLGLLGALVQSGSSPGMPRSDPRQPSSSTSMPFELLRAMREAGVVKALARVLRLIDTSHAQAKDAINAILKPLEVLTRPLPKQLATTDPGAQQELQAVLEQEASQPASDAVAVASARVHSQQTVHAAARGSTDVGPAAAEGLPAAGELQAASGVAGVGRSRGESGSSGARAAIDEDRSQQAGEAAAGPNALAAAGRFVAGGAGQAPRPLPDGLIDHLMEQLVDIEVELGAGGGDHDSSDEEGSSDGDNQSNEGDEDSDEDMAEGEEHEDGIEGHAAAGGSDEGVMGDAPSLTEGGEESDVEAAHGELLLGGAGANAGMDVVAVHGPEIHHMGDMNSSEEEADSDDDHEHHHHPHHHHFEDEMLPEDEMHLLPPQLQGPHHAQDGVDPLDDEEEEEEEEEYLDDDDEPSDDEAGRFDADMTADDFLSGAARFSWEMPGEVDNMPTALMMPGTFGRAAARRMLYRPAATTAAAGVWDDVWEPANAGQDSLNGAASVQMLLSQFGINANGASSAAMIGPNGRQYRMAVLAPDGSGLAATGRAGAGAMAGAMTGALYSLSMQLMPQQHRLLALPPRIPVSDSAALVESAGAAVPTSIQATEAAATEAVVGIRANAVSVNALTRLLARTPEGAGVTSYLRDGARARLAAQRQGGLFSVALDPAGIPATLGPAANFLQSVDLLQPGTVLSGAPGAGALADVDNSVWDEAVSQLLEALAPQGLGRVRTTAAAPGAARAGVTAEDAVIDPRSLESQMLALLRAQAPPPSPGNEQQQQEAHAAPGEAGEQAHAWHTQAATGTASHSSPPTAADAVAEPQVPGAAEARAGPRALTQEVLAAAIRAAMQEEPAITAGRSALAQHQPAAAAAQPQHQPQNEQQQHEQAATATGVSSHPVQIVSSTPDSPTAGAPVGRSTGIEADQTAPMDIEEAAPQAIATATTGPTAAAAGGGGAALAVEGGGPAEQEALRQAAEAAEVDLAFLEALPEELRVEVLSARGVELRLPQPTAALQPQAAATDAPAPAAQEEVPAAAPSDVAAGSGVHTPAAAAAPAAAEPGAAPDTPAPGAVPAPTEAANEEVVSIDPEFLAALPEDIRQEVLAQQAAERRARAATRAAQQRQQEMGLADLLAAMDDDARADALGQLQDSDLAQLPPMMRAQAQALRERVARQQQALQQQQAAMAAQQQQQHDFMLRRAQLGSGGLAGMMGGAASRLLMPMGPDGLPLGGNNRFGPLSAGLGSSARISASRAELLEAAGQAAEEAEGPPLLDESELAVLVHLLRANLPLSKLHLQKLLLNLAGHSITREQLLRKLLSLLRSLPGSSSLEDSTAAEQQERMIGSGQLASMDTSDGTSSGQPPQQLGVSAALDVLGAAVVSPVNRAASAAAEGSSLVVFGPQGKPAIISRRVLDMLAYLSRHSQLVARQMLQLRIAYVEPAQGHDDKGKGKSAATNTRAAAPRAVEVLLAMLSAPLCQRSLTLLEQLALLLEVVLSTVQRYEADLAALAAMRAARKKQQEEGKDKIKAQEQHTKQEQQQPASNSDRGQQQQPNRSGSQQAAATVQPGTSSPLQQTNQPVKVQASPPQPQSELTSTVVSIAPGLLQQLPGLLAREALSESAYVSIAKVIKLIVESAPVHLPLMLTMLVDGVAGVATRLLTLLDIAAANGIDADAQLAPAIGTKSGVVLRMLYALQGFQTEVKAVVKQQEQQQQQQEVEEGQAASTAGGSTSPTRSSATPAIESGHSSRPAAGASTSAAGSSAAASIVSSLDPVAAASEVDKAVASVANRTSPLWKALSSCILRVEDNLRAVLPQHTHTTGESAGHAAARLLPPGAQQVLPLVEAFFVLCALQGAIPAAPSVGRDLLTAPSAELSMLGGLGATAAAAPGSGSSVGRAMNPSPSAAGQLKRGASAALDAATSVDGCMSFLKFAERHRRLLNAYIRRNTSLLESSLAPLMGLPKLIDFDNKRAYFKSKVRAQEDRTYAGGLRLAVKRSTVFEDSFNKLRSRTPAEMRGKLSVSFLGEEGIDAGGVSREWYQVMAREIFNPNLALFVSVPEGGTTFQPNPNSVVQSDTGVSHLEFFKFVGRLVGKALYDGQLMDAHFTRSFYKHMLGQPLTYEDIEAVDPEYYKNLKWMLENDIADVLDLTFTAESDFFGKTEIVELIPGGREVKVTEANKHDYVNLIARHRMTTSIKAQIQGFLEGFWQLVPRDLISIFNDHELELLISGLPDIDVADLRANTEYTGYSAGSPVIQWFWQVVGEMDKQDLALLLQFVTGTSKVPLGGFKALQGISGPQRFQIHKSYGTDRLPSAHTCFNQLDLPEYESKGQLAERLAVAVHEGHEGFGFG